MPRQLPRSVAPIDAQRGADLLAGNRERYPSISSPIGGSGMPAYTFIVVPPDTSASAGRRGASTMSGRVRGAENPSLLRRPGADPGPLHQEVAHGERAHDGRHADELQPA